MLLRGAGSSALEQSIQQVYARVGPLRAGSLGADPERPRRAVAEFGRIVDEVEVDEVEAAVTAAVEHLRAAAVMGVDAIVDRDEVRGPSSLYGANSSAHDGNV